MAKPKRRKRDNRGSKSEVAKARRILAANRPKRGRRKRPPGPTKFQRFLMKEGPAAMGKVKAWRYSKKR